MKSSFYLILFVCLTVFGLLLGYALWNQTSETVDPLGGLEWLRAEFDLDEEQFSKIEELHNAYAPFCEIMCDRVSEAQETLDRKMMDSTAYNEELENELQRFSRLKEECHREMLKHFYEVAEVMKPHQRERYMQKAKKYVTLHDRVTAWPHDFEPDR